MESHIEISYSFVISFVILAIVLITEVMLFLKIGWARLDKLAIFLMASYLSVMLLRSISLLYYMLVIKPSEKT